MWFSFLINDVLILEILIFFNIFFFLNVINIITFWYLAGIYLLLLGLFLFLQNGDIFVGFLWVIDLGVGLIFFIFILHFSNFLHQKSTLNLTNKFFFFSLFIFFFLLFFLFFFKNSIYLNFTFFNNWFFYISWYDYYEFYNILTITDLNLIREIYFFNNSFEFFLINFMLFYGIFCSINLCFLIKRIFNFLTFNQIKTFNFLTNVNSYLFIRNQNYIKQQNISTGVRIWLKNKNFKI